jgi:pilus assembly protein CpaE
MKTGETTAMHDRPTVVLLEASQERQALAASALARTAALSKDLGVLAPPASHKSPVVLVDLAGDLERALKRLEEVRSSVPKAQIVALAERKEPDVILRAMRAGACEFAILDEGPELVRILQGLLTRATAEEPGGTIVSVFPAKGGVGATTLATNLAGALCGADKRVLLVDLDRHLGDVMVALDVTPGCCIADIVTNLRRLDRELLLASLAQHPSGAYVVAQADPLVGGEAVSTSHVGAVLRFLAKHFDYVVCDGMHGFEELSVAVLDASHRVELVLTQDVVALNNAKRCLEIFHRLHYEETKLSLVVNRFHKRNAIDLVSISENLGLSVHSALAEDHSAALTALNRGVLLKEAAPRSQLTVDIDQLAAIIAGTPQAKRRGGFGALFGRADPPKARSIPSKPSVEPEAHYDVARRTSEAS